MFIRQSFRLIEILAKENRGFTITELYKKLNGNYPHIRIMVEKLEKIGVVKTKKIGRKRWVVLNWDEETKQQFLSLARKLKRLEKKAKSVRTWK